MCRVALTSLGSGGLCIIQQNLSLAKRSIELQKWIQYISFPSLLRCVRNAFKTLQLVFLGIWSQLLRRFPLPNITWICPTAPSQPVSLFGGFPSTAWFDVSDLSENAQNDIEGLDASAAHVTRLLSTEPTGNRRLNNLSFQGEGFQRQVSATHNSLVSLDEHVRRTSTSNGQPIVFILTKGFPLVLVLAVEAAMLQLLYGYLAVAVLDLVQVRDLSKESMLLVVLRHRLTELGLSVIIGLCTNKSSNLPEDEKLHIFGVSTLEATAHDDFRKLASATYLQFIIRYAISGKAWDLVIEQRIAFTRKKDFEKEERELKWAHA
ncbi:Plasma membrane ATPase 3 [Camellia lanceoleosa]|uniref:Plasma membrane ATPase 3 n=1 Tax=Camellia lanceoleosa TaxID=1840588 RepID=A0ACC0HIF2_9ERIC|nr:Plasma membrane ATPase 3 [Camellia lanceoleosa]